MSLRDDLIGAWRLEDWVMSDEHGCELRPFGQRPTGMIVYSQAGVMSVAMMRSERRPFAINDMLSGTHDEKAAAFGEFLSYAGTFTTEGDRVRHRVLVSLFPNWIGTTQERIVRVHGDALELSTDPKLIASGAKVTHIHWRRVRSSQTIDSSASGHERVASVPVRNL